jgi:hypothetical protein
LERLRTAAGKALRSGPLAFTWEDISLSISPGSKSEEDLAREIFETVELAVSKGRHGVVLLLDEAQLIRDERDRHGEHPLSLLIAPIVALQRQELPLGFVACGLPTLTANLQKARSYTERLFRGEEVDSLSHSEALAALTGPLETTAADTASEERLTLNLLNAAREDIYMRLDRDFYDPRIAILTPAEQEVLLGSSSCPYPPLRSADLNEVSDKTPGNINVLLGRLVEAGVLYRIRKGEYAYTAPKFPDYLHRRVASLDSTDR